MEFYYIIMIFILFILLLLFFYWITFTLLTTLFLQMKSIQIQWLSILKRTSPFYVYTFSEFFFLDNFIFILKNKKLEKHRLDKDWPTCMFLVRVPGQFLRSVSDASLSLFIYFLLFHPYLYLIFIYK